MRVTSARGTRQLKDTVPLWQALIPKSRKAEVATIAAKVSKKGRQAKVKPKKAATQPTDATTTTGRGVKAAPRPPAGGSGSKAAKQGRSSKRVANTISTKAATAKTPNQPIATESTANKRPVGHGQTRSKRGGGGQSGGAATTSTSSSRTARHQAIPTKAPPSRRGGVSKKSAKAVGRSRKGNIQHAPSDVPQSVPKPNTQHGTIRIISPGGKNSPVAIGGPVLADISRRISAVFAESRKEMAQLEALHVAHLQQANQTIRLLKEQLLSVETKLTGIFKKGLLDAR